MRSIKYRAIGQDNKAYYVSELHFMSGGYYIHGHLGMDGFLSGWLNVQFKSLDEFTGLLDKNGKEIYEGDIVSHKEKIHTLDNRDEYREVRQAINMDRYNKFTFLWAMHEYEVIGNIHENPELLSDTPTLLPGAKL